MRSLLLATNNPGKVREFTRLLAGLPFQVVTPEDRGINVTVDETGSTYEQNARLKAEAFARAGDCLALADDSGLEVDALGGAPGLHSARYGGEGLDDRGRVILLLHNLKGLPPDRRKARFRAVVVVAGCGTEARSFEGVFEGAIADAPRGNDGFGYDPVFLLPDGRTAAELPPGEKDRLSHRGIAVRKAAAYLETLA
ncbi:MAG: RdgB/HAM1 family non-canonical purine NTP pyrophosphatase [Dehalococcoidia bacterium]